MKVYSQLISAQVENKASDYSATVVGRIWWNTATSLLKTADGTNVRALLRNDAKCILGNTTSGNNIRLHRGAAGVLQFVADDDATAEGTLSTDLQQISGRMENYTTAGRPAAAAANAGRIYYDTTDNNLYFDKVGTWTAFASGATTERVNGAWDIVIGSAAEVTSGAATHSTWSAAIAAATAGDNVLVLSGSWTETISISKRLNISGAGYDSVMDGTVTFTSGAVGSRLTNVRVTDDITLNAGANNVIVNSIYLLDGKSFLVDDTVLGEILEATLY